VCELNGIEQPVLDERVLLPIRVKYLKNMISKEKFSSLIEIKYRHHQHAIEQYEVIVMLRTTVTDFMRQAVVGEIRYVDMVQNILRVGDYANDSLRKICRRYNLATYFIRQHVKEYTYFNDTVYMQKFTKKDFPENNSNILLL